MARRSPAQQSVGLSDLVVGAFRVTEMSHWPMTLVEARGPAYIRICKDGTGHFAFEHIRGDLAGQIEVRNGLEAFTFRWEGLDGDMPVDGIGYATSTGPTLLGAFTEREGPVHEFTARRVKSLPRRPSNGLFRLT